MKLRKYWVNGSFAVIIAERYDHSLFMFQNLFEEAKKDFPKLRERDVECYNVVKSSSVKGCPMIKFDTYEPREGYHTTERLNDVEWFA